MAEKDNINTSQEVYVAYTGIPYALINLELQNSNYSSQFISELKEISNMYEIYKKGMKFAIEGTNGDYVGSKLKYKMAASLINKEARFLFAETPDVVVDIKGSVTKGMKESLGKLQDFIKSVLEDDANMFEKSLLQAAKDCFIGKRVACFLNFSEEDGIDINFLNSKQFIYEYDNNGNNLVKFTAFVVVKDRTQLSDKRIFRKRYIMESDGLCWFEDKMFDGTGKELEVINEYQPTVLDFIPAVVIANDGLTGEVDGVSEIELLCDFEGSYSKLSNADIDAARKSMNPIRYTVDMEPSTTTDLSCAPGSYWDLTSNQNLDKPNVEVGELKSSLEYSESLGNTLSRIKASAYEQVDMPDISLESMTGIITSGKALKTVYWPLIVRCSEKMKTWGPKLRSLINMIIKGAYAYPETIKKYTEDVLVPIPFEVKIVQNCPLPEDEDEEKAMDLSEVAAQTMSRKSFMQKWRQMTDEEVDEELQQIAFEKQLFEESYSGDMYGSDTSSADGTGVDDVPEDDDLNNEATL